MRVHKMATIGAGITIVGLSFASTPAFADPYTPDSVITVGPNAGYWDWENSNNWSLNGVWNTVWDFAAYNNSTIGSAVWDYTGLTLGSTSGGTPTDVICPTNPDLSSAADGSGDLILTCDAQTIDNGDGALSVAVESRFYADGQTWRQRLIVTNPGTAEVASQTARFWGNAWQDARTALSYTDSQGLTNDWATGYDAIPSATVLPQDLMWITDDRTVDLSTINIYPAPVVTYAVGEAGSTVLPSASSGGLGNGDEMSNTYFELPALAPGQTVELIVLNKAYLFNPMPTAVAPMNPFQTGTYAALQTAIADTTLQSDAVVFAGVADSSLVLNWTESITPAPTPIQPDPTLAATGSESAATLWVALSAMSVLVVGLGFTAVRRRRSTH